MCTTQSKLLTLDKLSPAAVSFLESEFKWKHAYDLYVKAEQAARMDRTSAIALCRASLCIEESAAALCELGRQLGIAGFYDHALNLHSRAHVVDPELEIAHWGCVINLMQAGSSKVHNFVLRPSYTEQALHA